MQEQCFFPNPSTGIVHLYNSFVFALTFTKGSGWASIIQAFLKALQGLAPFYTGPYRTCNISTCRGNLTLVNFSDSESKSENIIDPGGHPNSDCPLWWMPPCLKTLQILFLFQNSRVALKDIILLLFKDCFLFVCLFCCFSVTAMEIPRVRIDAPGVRCWALFGVPMSCQTKDML